MYSVILGIRIRCHESEHPYYFVVVAFYPFFDNIMEIVWLKVLIFKVPGPVIN